MLSFFRFGTSSEDHQNQSTNVGQPNDIPHLNFKESSQSTFGNVANSPADVTFTSRLSENLKNSPIPIGERALSQASSNTDCSVHSEREAPDFRGYETGTTSSDCSDLSPNTMEQQSLVVTGEENDLYIGINQEISNLDIEASWKTRLQNAVSLGLSEELTLILEETANSGALISVHTAAQRALLYVQGNSRLNRYIVSRNTDNDATYPVERFVEKPISIQTDLMTGIDIEEVSSPSFSSPPYNNHHQSPNSMQMSATSNIFIPMNNINNNNDSSNTNSTSYIPKYQMGDSLGSGINETTLSLQQISLQQNAAGAASGAQDNNYTYGLHINIDTCNSGSSEASNGESGSGASTPCTPPSAAAIAAATRRPDPIFVMDLLPGVVGWVIGRAGARIKEIQQQCSCKMWVDQDVPDDQPRKLYFQGTKQSIDIAVARVNGLLAEAPLLGGKHGAVNRIACNITECPAELVGLLIGKKGWTIKKIQAESGAQIAINQSVREGLPRKIIVSGDDRSVRLALQLIDEVLRTKSEHGEFSHSVSSGVVDAVRTQLAANLRAVDLQQQQSFTEDLRIHNEPIYMDGYGRMTSNPYSSSSPSPTQYAPQQNVPVYQQPQGGMSDPSLNLSGSGHNKMYQHNMVADHSLNLSGHNKMYHQGNVADASLNLSGHSKMYHQGNVVDASLNLSGHNKMYHQGNVADASLNLSGHKKDGMSVFGLGGNQVEYIDGKDVSTLRLHSVGSSGSLKSEGGVPSLNAHSIALNANVRRRSSPAIDPQFLQRSSPGIDPTFQQTGQNLAQSYNQSPVQSFNPLAQSYSSNQSDSEFNLNAAAQSYGGTGNISNPSSRISSTGSSRGGDSSNFQGLSYSQLQNQVQQSQLHNSRSGHGSNLASNHTLSASAPVFSVGLTQNYGNSSGNTNMASASYDSAYNNQGPGFSRTESFASTTSNVARVNPQLNQINSYDGNNNNLQDHRLKSTASDFAASRGSASGGYGIVNPLPAGGSVRTGSGPNPGMGTGYDSTAASSRMGGGMESTNLFPNQFSSLQSQSQALSTNSQTLPLSQAQQQQQQQHQQSSSSLFSQSAFPGLSPPDRSTEDIFSSPSSSSFNSNSFSLDETFALSMGLPTPKTVGLPSTIGKLMRGSLFSSFVGSSSSSGGSTGGTTASSVSNSALTQNSQDQSSVTVDSSFVNNGNYVSSVNAVRQYAPQQQQQQQQQQLPSQQQIWQSRGGQQSVSSSGQYPQTQLGFGYNQSNNSVQTPQVHNLTTNKPFQQPQQQQQQQQQFQQLQQQQSQQQPQFQQLQPQQLQQQQQQYQQLQQQQLQPQQQYQHHQQFQQLQQQQLQPQQQYQQQQQFQQLQQQQPSQASLQMQNVNVNLSSGAGNNNLNLTSSEMNNVLWGNYGADSI